MYDAIVIGPIVIKYSLIIIIGSFLLTMLLFRLISPFDKKMIKSHLEVITDLLLFIAFSVFGAKIILNIQLFITEPIAVLSYPSDANALYIASIVVIARIIWLVKKQKVIWRSFFDSLTRFLLFSHFISLFSMMIFSNQSVLLYQLAIHFMILVVLIWLGEKAVSDQRFIPLILIALGLSQAVIGFIYPVTFYGYYVSASYYLLIAFFGAYQFYQVSQGRSGD